MKIKILYLSPEPIFLPMTTDVPKRQTTQKNLIDDSITYFFEMICKMFLVSKMLTKELS